MVFKRIKHREGDIFVIPLHDGRFAVCQVICALYGRFKKVFSFGVLSIGQNQAYEGETTYLPFTNYRGRFEVIFTATIAAQS
ncbi:immunity 26/phosphotriesterase HocA family protein [Paenibacillus polymyxa]|uniref:immunity 26/phosphotriesterase HocA family protein n=1 Tax=Paenibacillus polymyxa TaxID=1406 RepID=UPI0037C7A453